MKVAILAGGFGTRLAEETKIIPKPLVKIGEQPILWHVMRHYAHYGFRDFAIALGYKSEEIKRYFADYSSLQGSMTVDFQKGEITQHESPSLFGRVDLIETGLHTNTGGRIKRLAPYVGSETFMLTWGDGVSNIDLHDLLRFHRSHGKLATLTAVHPVARFGHLHLDGDQIVQFEEKPQFTDEWVNGAFFVLEPDIFDYIEGDATQWEKEPLETLAREGQLMAYKHQSFWQCMDTIRDKRFLQKLWDSGEAPWKIWE